MAVTKEFLQAVNDRNILRMRLIMKNCLLIDTSFKNFLEMEAVAKAHGINVWQNTSEFELIKREKPWSLDDMNYELTAIVNDFTKEHMNYLMDIIREVYAKNSKENKERDINSETTGKQGIKLLHEEEKNLVPLEKYYYELFVQYIEIAKALQENRINKGKKLSKMDIKNISWTSNLVSDVRIAAKRIVELCNQIDGRNK